MLEKEKNKITLCPVNQLDYDVVTETWNSLGGDPYFFVEGNYSTGWVKMRVCSSCSNIIPLKIYWDNGHGITEHNSARIGVLPVGNNVDSEFFFYIPNDVKHLRLDPGTRIERFKLDVVEIRRVTKLQLLRVSYQKYRKKSINRFQTSFKLLAKVIHVFRNHGMKGLAQRIKNYLTTSGLSQDELYQEWISSNQICKDSMKKEIESFKHLPLVSIILPVYNTEEDLLRKAIESIKMQLYTNWELCICDDNSTKSYIKKILDEYRESDNRIRVTYRFEQGNISEASNTALELANGDFIALLDHDDELAPEALFEVVKLLNKYPDTDMIYTDEDKIDNSGRRHTPYFKPDWSPDTFLSQMYTCHLGVYRTKLVKEVGGFRTGFEGSQDYDLVLRLTEKTNKIRHINKILYHWRSIPSSTSFSATAKDYTTDAGYKALVEAIERRGYNAEVTIDQDYPNVYLVHHKPVNNPLISILIPTRDMSDILSKCLESIFTISKYPNFEVIIVDNGSKEKQTFELFDSWLKREKERFKVLRLDIPFNYSRLNNMAVDEANGELILLLNNDIEVISPDWLNEMAGQAIRPEVGAVGSCLLYPDDTIQHAGVVLGISGTAGHSHKHFDAKHPGYFSRLRMISNYSAVTGACLMVKKSVFREVGGLNEQLEVAFNDVDFCLKLREKNYLNICLPQVKLYHHESKSRGYENTPEKQERFNKEADILKSRWGWLIEADPYYSKHLTREKEDFSIFI